MRVLLLCLALLSLRCAPVHQRAQALPSVSYPTVVLSVRADPEFTPSERLLIETAVLLIREQTGGRVYVSLSYSGIADWKLTRLAADSDKAAKFDMSFGHTVLGVCDRTWHEMYLITSRLESDAEFVHVAAHELLHSAGLEHIHNPQSIMYSSAYVGSGVLMNSDDMLELCRVVKCR